MTHEILFFEDEHKYLVDGEEVPSVTTILNYMSDVEYSKVNPSVLEQAARRGSLVHEYTELIDYGAMPDEIEFEVKGYLEAYAKFLRDYKPDWDGVEKMTYSEEFHYIGTIDRIKVGKHLQVCSCQLLYPFVFLVHYPFLSFTNNLFPFMLCISALVIGSISTSVTSTIL